MLIDNPKLKTIADDYGWTELTAEDRNILGAVTTGRKFNFKHTLGVARRCKFGKPQVLVCMPYSSDGVPFPTLFWLVCPYLTKKCGILESKQKIHEVELLFAENLKAVNQWHLEYQKLRTALVSDKAIEYLNQHNPVMLESMKYTGVGGIAWKKNPSAVKCLHLQVGTWMGMHNHPTADFLTEILGVTECSFDECSKLCKKIEKNKI